MKSRIILTTLILSLAGSSFAANRDSSTSLGMTDLGLSSNPENGHAELAEASRRRRACDTAEQPSTVIPVPSRLKKFMPKLHNEKLAEAKAGNIDVVMIGDSITHGWSRHPGALKVTNLLNLGFPGDRTQNVLWRLQHGAVDGISPRLVTLLIGTNHMHDPKKGYTPDTTADIFTGIQAVVAELRQRLPKAKILVFSVFPRKPGGPNDSVAEFNACLPRLVDGQHVFHADINRTFLDAQGSYNAALYSRDGLHLSAKGYAAWAEALAPILKKEGIEITK